MTPDAIFTALADPTRRGLYEGLVKGGAQPVHALTAAAGVSQPAVSKHLRVLEGAGLVAGERQGRTVLYTARAGALAPLVDWAAAQGAFWEGRIDRLEDLLRRMDR